MDIIDKKLDEPLELNTSRCLEIELALQDIQPYPELTTTTATTLTAQPLFAFVFFYRCFVMAYST